VGRQDKRLMAGLKPIEPIGHGADFDVWRFDCGDE
jgi:hypothetical protein